jgi:hypothetical protein
MQDECIHSMERNTCIHCRRPPVGINQTVYVTKSGNAFHNSATCEALAHGQDDAYGKGMKNHPVTPVGWGQAFNDRHPCRTCCPEFYRNNN